MVAPTALEHICNEAKTYRFPGSDSVRLLASLALSFGLIFYGGRRHDALRQVGSRSIRQLHQFADDKSNRRTAMKSPWQAISVPALATILMIGIGGKAQAACYASDRELPASVVSQFINDPGRLLAQFPNGGPQMISLVRDLVASDPGSLSLIINLAATANAEQIQAIGTGLGQAGLLCSRTAQGFASEILQMTAASNNQPLSQAFSAVMGDLFLSSTYTAGVGGGGGGGTTTSGAVGGVFVSGVTFNLRTSVPTGSTNSLTSGTFKLGSPGNLITLGTPPSPSGPGGSHPNTLSKSVSPSRP